MGKQCPACFNPRETRVIVQYGSKVHSFRLLKDCPNIFPESNPVARVGLARLMAGEKADPEDIVSQVLDEPDRSKLYRCGGPCGFEPVAGKYNYWVTDLTHRDRTAPKLSSVRDAWEYNYQIYPRKLLDAVCESRIETRRRNSGFRRMMEALMRLGEAMEAKGENSPEQPQDRGEGPDKPNQEEE